MVTLQDIANATGVTKMTVSNVLRGRSNVGEETRTRILETAKAMHYHANPAARTLTTGRTGVIEIVVQDFDLPFYSKLASYLSRSIERRGFQPLFRQSLYSSETEHSAVDPLTGFNCDALIMATPSMSTREIDEVARNRPVLLIDDKTDEPLLPSISTACETGVHDAVSHLFSQGARHPVILGTSLSSRETSNSDVVGRRRLAGVAEAFREQGRELTERDCIPVQWTMDAARASARLLVERRPDCDAVFCMSDTIAFGVMRGLRELGIGIPEDMRIIAVDGATMGEYTTPSLSTVAIDMEGVAELAADRIVAIMKDHDEGHRTAPKVDEAPYKLLIRESST